MRRLFQFIHSAVSAVFYLHSTTPPTPPLPPGVPHSAQPHLSGDGGSRLPADIALRVVFPLPEEEAGVKHSCKRREES